jgi:hypothetical protein
VSERRWRQVKEGGTNFSMWIFGFQIFESHDAFPIPRDQNLDAVVFVFNLTELRGRG